MNQTEEKIYSPGKDELKHFGILMGVIIIILFGILLPIILKKYPSYVVWIIGFLFIFLAYFNPFLLKPIYSAWMKFGLVMNKITTPILLGFVFYLIITPIGIIMRLAGKDILNLKINKKLDTYRTISRHRSKDSLERPF
ncbi:MAG: SxtJ family membrane protein [Proteobacteria bacterium]|nr:SxtJ family membrane protein [Pseudomonadota bacterium]